MKKLFRSHSDARLGGVLGGIGSAIGVDANVLRLIYAVLTIFTGFIPLVVIYVLAWAILPMSHDTQSS